MSGIQYTDAGQVNRSIRSVSGAVTLTATVDNYFIATQI